MRAAVLALATVLCWQQAAECAGWSEEDKGQCRATGVYENTWYGFTVRIPADLKGCPNSPVGLSDHGVVIPLASADPNRNIECYAAYNVLFHESASAAVDAAIEWVVQDLAVPRSVTVLRRQTTTLGSLPAVRVVIRYKDKETGVELILDSTQAVRIVIKQYEGPSHEYDVKLTTPVSLYLQDRRVLEAVLSTWRLGAPLDAEQK